MTSTGTRPAPRCVVGTASAALLALTLAACAGDGPGSGTEIDGTGSGTTASSDPAGSPSAATRDDGDDSDDDATGDAPSTDEPFVADAAPDSADPSADAALVVTDVRVGRHDGFDRVVLDLEGTGAPGWSVQYVDAAADDGSGEPVAVDGDGVLQVRLSGMAMPGEDPDIAEYDGATLDPEGTDAVEEVVYRFWFEGYTTAFVGVDEPGLPFRVFALEDPARVVVDVRHPTDD
ncbi:AMIN-like domain-containing (lipo)protein [Isoptericola variabilis]|uniref:AMIN-like domain-containing (lipo)protein n=1 Tax=Isoptericola variabilis TaxID=139208 RepID=UPI003D1FED74